LEIPHTISEISQLSHSVIKVSVLTYVGSSSVASFCMDMLMGAKQMKSISWNMDVESSVDALRSNIGKQIAAVEARDAVDALLV